MSTRTPYAAEMYARAEVWVPSILAREPGVTSADKAYAYLRDAGYAVPRSAVREVWREAIRGQDYIAIANRLESEDRVPESWMTPTEWDYSHRYNYVVEISGTNDITGLPETRHVTVTSDTLITIGEAEGDAANAAFNYGLNIVGGDFAMSLSSVRVARGRTWSR